MGELEYLQYDPDPPRFQRRTLQLIEQVNIVIEEAWADGIRLTKRATFYQFVRRGWLKNTTQNWQRLKDRMTDGMRAGLIPWNAIVDLGRSVYGRRHYSSAADYLRDMADDWGGNLVGIDRWQGQAHRPVVYVEKNAALGIVETVCRELDIDYAAGVGYGGDSFVRSIAVDLMLVRDLGQEPVVILLTDHDPRGVHMEDDLRNRLAMFCNYHGHATPEINRIVLTLDQVRQHDLDTPELRQKVKGDDKLAPAYIERHGVFCWELDALPPSYVRDLLRETIESYRTDRKAWDAMQNAEEIEREKLLAFADQVE